MFFKKISLVTGGFDPIHSGHISYFKRAKDFSDYLVVGINTEEWLTNKKGQYFQSWVERAEIIRHLEMVDAVVSWEDDEVGSACGAISKCLEIAETVVFCNGGDRGSTNTPELDMYGDNPRVEFQFGVGGDDKMNSSSWILKGYFDRQRNLLGI
jgi:D-beta-D-heptose 7-phosphate kinase/D-beta-D-heptose 1-phosphate adenosyltransferase|tara:strand:+ start:626 stop:1087 length:462 start_codon:yes stop_codon:yes gene_type:complete